MNVEGRHPQLLLVFNIAVGKTELFDLLSYNRRIWH